MKLNLEQKRYFSDTNMKRILSIITGMMSSVDSVASQCLTDYDNTGRVYQRGSITIYDGYIWEALTVTQGAWDESKWTKIGTDEFTELDVDTIKGFLSLTPEQLETMANLISTEIRLDKVFSSSDTYTRIDNALKEAKQYCITQLAKKSTGSFKIATSEAEVVDGNYLYLIMNSSTSKYEIFALVEGSVQKLTTVEVNLSEYFTKIEIEADFLKKTDADGKYATITTVDGKVDKTNILTANSSTATDDQVYSAKAMNTELDGVVKKTDISTTIDKTSTDDTVPSTKAVYNATSNFIKTYTSIEQLGLTNGSETMEDIANSMEDFTRLIAIIEGNESYPFRNGTLIVEKSNIYRVHFKFCMDESPVVYVGSYHAISGFTGWRKLCTTSVTDVPTTNITFTDSNVSIFGDTEICKYCVLNGICYVTLNGLKFSSEYVSGVGFAILPRPAFRQDFELTNSYGDISLGKLFLEPHGGIHLYTRVTPIPDTGFISFSYPVAE